MKLNEITDFLCPNCFQWINGQYCEKCKYTVQPGDSCRQRKCADTLYDCYRPARPLDMSPVKYYKKYGCVDDNFTRITNGRYYCNPVHCNTSWIHKENRDKHLKRAYAALR